MPRLPQDKISKIYEAHRLGMIVTEAAGYAGVDKMTISNYWRNAGLSSPNPQYTHGRPRVTDFPEGHITGNEAARRLKVSRAAISSFVDNEKLEGYRADGHLWVSEEDVTKEKIKRGIKDSIER